MVDHNGSAEDEADKKKKKKTRFMVEAVLAHGSQTSFGFDNVERVNQITRTVQADGSYTPKANAIERTNIVRFSYFQFPLFPLLFFIFHPQVKSGVSL